MSVRTRSLASAYVDREDLTRRITALFQANFYSTQWGIRRHSPRIIEHFIVVCSCSCCRQPLYVLFAPSGDGSSD